jgi:hypothetical protein
VILRIFFKVPLKKWHIVYTKPGEKVVAGFVNLAQSQGPKMGIRVEMPTMTALPNDVSRAITLVVFTPVLFPAEPISFNCRNFLYSCVLAI